MYETISPGPPAVKLQAWKDLTAMWLWYFFPPSICREWTFPYLKDNLVAIAHQTRQSLRLIVRKLNRWGSLTLMHFAFGPCSTIVASEKGEAGRGGGRRRRRRGDNFGMLEVLREPERSVRCKTRHDPSLMWEVQPLWSATHMDLVVSNRKPPFSCWF